MKLDLSAAEMADARANLGVAQRKKFDDFAKERRPREIVWMQNLRTYLGKYDPDIEAKIDKTRSKVCPRDVRARIHGFVAKMMEMMFPATETNFNFIASPIPTVSQQQQEAIIQRLIGEHQAAAQAEAQAQAQQAQPGVMTPPAQPQPKPLTTEEIELEIKKFADEKAAEMTKLCEDQLVELDYVQQVKKVVRSGAIYGWGVVKGPETRKQKTRTWVWDEKAKTYVPKNLMQPRPVYSYKKIWDIYPDYSAPSWKLQEGMFERTLLNRHGLLKIGKRSDFNSTVINEYLQLHPSGNYIEQPFESEIKGLNTNPDDSAAKKSRLYELIRWVGYINAHELALIGVDIPEDKMHEDVFADIWLLDDKIIKADTAPFGDSVSDVFHVFTYGDDEESGFDGVGMPVDTRDTHLSLGSVSRMLMDNSAAVAGPIFEINEELLARGKDVGAIHSFKTIYREGLGAEASTPAVRQISTESHIQELLAVLKMLREQLDIETNLPAWMLGSAQNLGEAFRTSRNMSVMTGGANLIMKDTVRQFDNFTVSVMASLYRFNMEFGPDEVKGDFQIVPKGVTSLVAKEVRGAALDQFLANATPEERALLKTREILIDRLQSRDLPIDRVYDEEEAKQILDGMRQAASAAAQAEAGLTDAKTAKTQADAQRSQAQAQKIMNELQASLEEINSRIASNMTNAKSTLNKDELQAMKITIDGMLGKLKIDADAKKASQSNASS